MIRTVYVTPPDEWPATQASIDAAGDAEILCGIPASLADVIPADHLGLFDIKTPDPEPVADTPTVENLQAQIDGLTQKLADAGIDV